MTPTRGFQLLRSGMAGVDLVAADSAHSFGRHTHDTFGIGLIERGAQKSASGRGVVEAGPGDVITVNPGEVHDGKPFDASGRRWRMAYLSPGRVRDAATDAVPGAAFEFTSPVMRDALLTAQLGALFNGIAAGDALRSDALLLALIARLLKPARCERPALTPGVIAARERIDDDPAVTPTLAALASQAGLSRYQFLRAFTRLTGLPPHAYLLQRRVQHAQGLVRGGVALADVAAQCGFADQSHMTRCFVRTFGLAPGAFARHA